MTALAIVARDPARDADLLALAARLGAPVLATPDPTVITLARDGLGLVLHATVAGGHAEVRVAANTGRARPSRRTSLLARAIGNARDGCVVDATAGLGRDTFELVALGYAVVACERQPLLAFLLRDALARHDLELELHEADATGVLSALTPGAAAAVCLDPMFPPRGKSAQVKKEAQLLQQLIGEEHDTPVLFAAAWRAAPRLVVKRPLRAPALAPGVSFAVTGRAVRFDVYLTAGRSMPAVTQTPAP